MQGSIDQECDDVPYRMVECKLHGKLKTDARAIFDARYNINYYYVVVVVLIIIYLFIIN